MRSPLRRAYEDGDTAALLLAIKADSTVSVSGCWLWSRSAKKGYPIISIDGRMFYVHRLSLEAKHGATLGAQAAHHTCAQPMCVNPQHLQPVTHRDNTAEMMARTYMTQRISDLEAALRALQPDHPLLDEISLPAAS